MQKMTATALLLLAMAAPALAQEQPEEMSMFDNASTQPSHATHRAVDTVPHPVHSDDASWAGNMLIVIGAMFIAARVVGPSVHVQMKEQADADAAAHDDHGHDSHDAHGHDSHAHH